MERRRSEAELQQKKLEVANSNSIPKTFLWTYQLEREATRLVMERQKLEEAQRQFEFHSLLESQTAQVFV